MSNISIYMDSDTLKLLDEIAESESRSRSNLLQKLLKDYGKIKEDKDN